MTAKIAQPAMLAGACGAAFVGFEAAAALLAPAPLDAPLQLGEVVVTVVLISGLHAAIAALLVGVLGARAAVVPALLWALVWALEGPRVAGASLAWGIAPLAILAAAGIRLPRLALTLAAFGGLWVPSWRPRWTTLPPPAAVTEGPDVLLVTVDTVREDAGLLDDLGDEWQRYPLAISAAPWTLPAMHSLFSGRPVHDHGGGLPVPGGWSARDPDAVSVVHAFRELGYDTIGLASNPHLGAAQGFADGFSRWTHSGRAREPLLLTHSAFGQRARWGGPIERRRYQRDDVLVAATLAEIERPSKRPRFIWLHLMSPHEYRRAAETPPDGWTPGTTQPRPLRAAYAGNILATRQRLSRVIAAATGWTIAVTSDHGEALGEEGRWGHGHRLWDAELRVPMAIRAPGLEPAKLTAQRSVAGVLPWLLGRASGVHSPTLPPSDTVPVGGLRDQAIGAHRTADGFSEPHSIAPAASASLLSAETQRALEALGYQSR